MKKRMFSLFTALILLVTSLQITAFAAPGSDDTLQPQYTYSNNGYTLEKVSHADVAPGQTDGFVDYYQYTDPDSKICTGVIEHMYAEGADTPTADTAAELAELESRLRKPAEKEVSRRF